MNWMSTIIHCKYYIRVHSSSPLLAAHPSLLLNNNILNQLLILASIIPDPVKDILMPQQRILAINHPMPLIREMQEATRDAQALQHIEQHNPLRDNNTVVQVIMHTELGRAEIRRVFERVKFRVVFDVVPDGAVLIVLDEEDFVGGVGAALGELAVVGYEGFEFATEGVSLDPVDPVLDISKSSPRTKDPRRNQ